MTAAPIFSAPAREWKVASATHGNDVHMRFEYILEPAMFSFPAWLTADFTTHWDTPIDVRYILDQAALHKGLCWLLRGDPHHQLPQLSAVAHNLAEMEGTPVEIRPIRSPNLDAMSWFLIVSELNKRGGIDARQEEIHEERYEHALAALPAVTVPYAGKA